MYLHVYCTCILSWFWSHSVVVWTYTLCFILINVTYSPSPGSAANTGSCCKINGAVAVDCLADIVYRILLDRNTYVRTCTYVRTYVHPFSTYSPYTCTEFSRNSSFVVGNFFEIFIEIYFGELFFSFYVTSKQCTNFTLRHSSLNIMKVKLLDNLALRTYVYGMCTYVCTYACLYLHILYLHLYVVANVCTYVDPYLCTYVYSCWMHT